MIVDSTTPIITDSDMKANAATTIEPVSWLGRGRCRSGFTSVNRFCSCGCSLRFDCIMHFLPMNGDMRGGDNAQANLVTAYFHHTDNDLVATVPDDDAFVLLP